jgi:hypothetical protein
MFKSKENKGSKAKDASVVYQQTVKDMKERQQRRLARHKKKLK